MSAHAPSSAMQIEERAAAFLERRRYWDWSEADQAELDAWLAAAMAHRVAWWRLEATLARTERLAALNPAGDAPVQSRRFAPLLVGIAACAAVAVFGWAGMKMASAPHDRVYATGVGGHETVSFADGTRIELNTDTVLRARMTSNQRTIWLEKGEAYFQVRHDPAHPFSVIAGNHRVLDLGTKFLVRQEPNRLEVALMEGRVRLGSANSNSHARPALLSPGDVATATPSTMFVTRQSPRALSNDIAWRHHVLVFDHATLADAASEFNRYNRQKIVIADPAVAQLMIDGTFRTNGVAAFVDVAQEVLKLHIENDGDEILISR